MQEHFISAKNLPNIVIYVSISNCYLPILGHCHSFSYTDVENNTDLISVNILLCLLTNSKDHSCPVTFIALKSVTLQNWFSNEISSYWSFLRRCGHCNVGDIDTYRVRVYVVYKRNISFMLTLSLLLTLQCRQCWINDMISSLTIFIRHNFFVSWHCQHHSLSRQIFSQRSPLKQFNIEKIHTHKCVKHIK